MTSWLVQGVQCPNLQCFLPAPLIGCFLVLCFSLLVWRMRVFKVSVSLVLVVMLRQQLINNLVFPLGSVLLVLIIIIIIIINGCRAGWGCASLVPAYRWFEWPSSSHHSMTTNCHSVAPFDFTTVSGCDQLVIGPTHARGGTLDILMTDVPDLVQVVVAAPIGNSDYSSLSAVISMAQVVPNLSVSMNIFLKHTVNWNILCGAIQDLPCCSIWYADNPVEVLNEHLFLHAGWTLSTNQDHPCAQ